MVEGDAALGEEFDEQVQSPTLPYVQPMANGDIGSKAQLSCNDPICPNGDMCIPGQICEEIPIPGPSNAVRKAGLAVGEGLPDETPQRSRGGQ